MARCCMKATVFVLLSVGTKLLYHITLYLSSPLDGHFSLYTLICSLNAYLLLLVLVMLVATLSCNFACIHIRHGGGPMLTYAILNFSTLTMITNMIQKILQSININFSTNL